MTIFKNRAGLSVLLVLGVMALGSVSAWGQGAMTCIAFSPNTISRSEGYTEIAGDLVIQCSGGTPTAPGQPVPQVDINVSFDLPVTNKVIAGNSFTDALLLVDEPNANLRNNSNGRAFPQTPLLNCGHAGAPDYGPSGAGVCSVAGTGNYATVYDGTANGFGPGATCDWAEGRPYFDAYGCGRPNAFQGQLTRGNPETITFPQVPIDPPGPGNVHLFRITNVRVNTVGAGLCTQYPDGTVFCDGGAIATVSMGGTPLVNGPIRVAIVRSGLSAQVTTTGDLQHGATIHVAEGFPSAWKAKNFSFSSGDHLGTSGNATLNPANTQWVYSGGLNYPADIAQNVPGTYYATESGFEWKNDVTNGPPFPNPPVGTSTTPGTSLDLGNSLDSAGYGSIRTNISAAGVAQAGTRIAVKFSKQSGYSVQVPPVVYLYNSTGPAVKTGVMVLTSTNHKGAGAYSPVVSPVVAGGPLVDPGNLAVYEVLFANSIALETADIPVTMVYTGDESNPPALKNPVTATVSFAPFFDLATDPGAGQPTPTDTNPGPTAIPRFAASKVPLTLFQAAGAP